MTLSISFAETLAGHRLCEDVALLVSLQLDQIASGKLVDDVHVGLGEFGDRRLASLLDEHLRRQLLAGSLLALRRVLAQRRQAAEVLAGDKAERIDFHGLHVGISGVGVAAELRQRLAQPVARIDVSRERFEDRPINVHGLLPLTLEGHLDRDVGLLLLRSCPMFCLKDHFYPAHLVAISASLDAAS